MLDELRSSGAIYTGDKTKVFRTVDALIYVPLSQKVKVVLVQDIHYLVSADTDPECFAEIMPRALRAFKKVLVNSPGIFSAEELETTTPEENCCLSERYFRIRGWYCQLYSCWSCCLQG